jgi:hypothetical protein
MERTKTHCSEVQEAMLRIAARVNNKSNLREAFRLENAEHQRYSVHSLEKYWYDKRNLEIRRSLGRVGRTLDPEQEALLVAFIQGFSRANWPLLPSEIRRLIKLQWDITVQKAWVSKFLKRHKKVLSKRVCKALSDKRSSIETLEDVEAFIREFSDGPAYPKHAIMNVDETRLNYRSNGYAFQRVGAADRQKHNLQATRKGKGGTLVSVVAADGTVFMSLWIFTGTPTKKSGQLTEMSPEEEEEAMVAGSAPIAPEGRTRSEVHPRYYAFNETGYMDAALWRALVEKIVERWNLLYPGLNLCLLSDQLAAHRNMDTIRFALANYVHLWSLTACTSHWGQPLDDIPFGNFKRILAHAHVEEMFANALREESCADSLILCAYKAESIAFTPAVIIAAFERTGIYPWSPEVIRERAKLNYGRARLSCDPHDLSEMVVSFKDDKRTNPLVQTGCTDVEVEVRPSAVHAPWELLRLHEEKVAAEEEKRRQKDEARARSTCQQPGCPKVHRGGKDWYVCEHCSHFVMCSEHKRHRGVAARHEETCNVAEEGKRVTRSKKRKLEGNLETLSKPKRRRLSSKTYSAQQ